MKQRGFRDALPIMLGYFPIALTFGVLAKNAGLSVVESVLMSLLVYAGASQFMAVSMLATGIGVSAIVSAVFLMNLRHLVMSASVRSRMEGISRRWYPIIGFYLTDEVFSILILKRKHTDPVYLVSLELASHLSWVAGTFGGYVLGAWVPDLLVQASGIALYALFVALLIPACRNSFVVPAVALAAAGMNTLLVGTGLLNSGLSFLVSVLLTSGLAATLVREEEELSHVS